MRAPAALLSLCLLAAPPARAGGAAAPDAGLPDAGLPDAGVHAAGVHTVAGAQEAAAGAREAAAGAREAAAGAREAAAGPGDAAAGADSHSAIHGVAAPAAPAVDRDPGTRDAKADTGKPATNEQQPNAANEQQPNAANEQQPNAANEQQPNAANEQQPNAANERQPNAASERQPNAANEQQPNAANEQQPNAASERPSGVADATATLAPSLFDVLVVARRPAAKHRTQDTTVVPGQRLRESARQSTLEALAQESGSVYVPGRGALHGVASGATGGVTIRGLGGSPNSQVLVVEDGVPDYQGIFGHPIPDAYVPFLLDDAILIKGGDSVLYGSNAMGGAILLRSRWRENEGHELLFDSAFGSYSTSRQTASLLARRGRADLAAAFFALSTDGHRPGAAGGELVAQAAARYRLGRGLELTLREKAVHLRGADPGPATHPNPDHWYDVWRSNSSAQLSWRAERVRLVVTPSLNLGVHRLYDGFHSLDYVAAANAEAEVKLHAQADLLLGLAGNHIAGQVENRITGERPHVQALDDVSLYQQLVFRPVPTVALVAGARQLVSATYGFALLYKTGASFCILPGLRVHGHLARNFRQPTLRELYLPFPTANPELRPEHSLNWDLGASWFSPHLEASLTGYRSQADDMIRYFGAWPTAEVVNVDHIVIDGVEARLRLRHLGPFGFTVTGDWRDVGRYTRQNPEAKLDFALEAGRRWGDHALSGSLTGEWVHGLHMANYGRQPIADVFFLDLSLRYRFVSAPRRLSLEPYLLVRNLLDRRYAYVAGYPMPGFHLLAGVKLEI
jgi:outer membrane cobalamin receptor